MLIAATIHVIIIMCVLFHMFNLGTIESENKWCYFTWPMMHLFYAFVNYIFIWFFCFNSYEIRKKNGQNILKVSTKFLKVFFFLSFTYYPLKMLSNKHCKAWTVSWKSVHVEFAHTLLLTLFFFVYFSWFEKKYIGFRVYYKSTEFN